MAEGAALNASAEIDAAHSNPPGVEGSAPESAGFLWDMLSAIQNIGLLVVGAAALMGFVSCFLFCATCRHFFTSAPRFQNLYYRQNSILFHPEVSGMPKQPHENPSPYSSPGEASCSIHP